MLEYNIYMLESKENLPRVITISTGTIFRAILVLLILGFLYIIRDVVAIFFGAMFLAALIDPLADYFERWKIPRGLAAIIIYIVGLSLVAGLVVLLWGPITSELGNFFNYFAPFIEGATGTEVSLHVDLAQESLSTDLASIVSTARESGISNAVPQIIEFGSSAIGGVTAVVVVLILAFFMIAEKTALVRAVGFVAPAEYQPFVMQISGKLRDRLGSWLRGQLVLMICVFVMTYLALLILDIPYALVLALMAGMFEIIPFVGPFASSIPAIVLALAISPVHAVITGGAYVLVQAIEGNILVPKIMQKATGVNPIVSLLAVLIGWRVGGIVGAILAIPLALVISVFLEELYFAHKAHAS